MKLYELDLGSMAGKAVYKLSGLEKKEQEERKALNKKTAGMYKKGIQDWERIKSENAEAFKENPNAVFDQWFEHYFDRKVDRIIDHPGLISSIKNKLADYAEALIMYAGQDYYLKAKTPQQGATEILLAAPIVTNDKKVQADVKKLFGKYHVTGKNQEKIADKLPPVDKNKDGKDDNTGEPVAGQKPKTGLIYTTNNGERYKFLGAQWGSLDTGRMATREVGAQLTQAAIDKGDVE
jgi:hypothetical protein